MSPTSTTSRIAGGAGAREPFTHQRDTEAVAGMDRIDDQRPEQQRLVLPADGHGA